MLVLARLRDEAIVIGDDITVSVVDIRGDKVRIGINAPRSVSVHRKEIYEQIKRENQAAAQVKPDDVASLVGSPQPSMKLASADAPSFMSVAIEEAKKSLSHNGLPIGAVLVREGRIIGRGHNRKVQRGDPMAHAELDALTNAGKQSSYHDTTLYTTLVPCLMCAGAILQCNIPKVIVGNTFDFDRGQCMKIKSPQLLRDCGVEFIDAQDPECVEMLASFMQKNPGAMGEKPKAE